MSGVTGAIGASQTARASKKAAEIQAEAARYATDVQAELSREGMAMYKKQHDQARADLAPWRAAGRMGLIGYSGAMKQYAQELETYKDLIENPEKVKATPGYEFRLKEGQRGIERSAAASGRTIAGDTLTALDRFSQGHASDEFDRAISRQASVLDAQNVAVGQHGRLAQLGGQGAEASANLSGQYGSNMMNQMGALGTAMGQGHVNAASAYAQGQIGSANAWSNALTGMSSGAMYGLANYQDIAAGAKGAYGAVKGLFTDGG